MLGRKQILGAPCAIQIIRTLIGMPISYKALTWGFPVQTPSCHFSSQEEKTATSKKAALGQQYGSLG